MRLSFESTSNRSNDNAPKLYGSRKARCSPYGFKLWMIFGIDSLALPWNGRTGAPSAVRRLVAASSSSLSTSEMLIEVKRPGDSSARLNAATELPSMKLVVPRISDRPGPQNGSMYAAPVSKYFLRAPPDMYA